MQDPADQYDDSIGYDYRVNGHDPDSYEDEADEANYDEIDAAEEGQDDMSYDADALASAGWGTDEDYGHFDDGGQDW